MKSQTAFDVVSCAELAAMQFPPLFPEPARVPTWAELIALEPALADVEALALRLHTTGRDDVRNWAAVKRAFLPLVGFTARRYELRNSRCYDVAYDHLLDCWENGSL